MAHIIDTNSKRRVSARLATGVAISTLLVLATIFAAPAGADEHRGGHWDNRGNRGYYPPPPVVYGTPYLRSTTGGLRSHRRHSPAGGHHRHSVAAGVGRGQRPAVMPAVFHSVWLRRYARQVGHHSRLHFARYAGDTRPSQGTAFAPLEMPKSSLFSRFKMVPRGGMPRMDYHIDKLAETAVSCS